MPFMPVQRWPVPLGYIGCKFKPINVFLCLTVLIMANQNGTFEVNKAKLKGTLSLNAVSTKG